MNLIKKFRNLLLGSSDGEIKDRDGIYFYIKCSQCGAPVRVRADKRHDLMRDYNTGSLIWNKEIMDGACFQLIHATVHFDPAYHITEKEITGGEFITWEEYAALTTPQSPAETET